MKILITGSTGMLGRYVMKHLVQSEYEVIATERSSFDLNNPNNIYQSIKTTKPDIILHLAAETNVDLCEREPSLAFIRNYKATEMIAMAASEIDAYMVFISTSNVFGYEGRLSYNELDCPYPINYYGKSKLLAEQAIQKHVPKRHLIIRAGWMIGGGEALDHKFVGQIISQIKNGAQSIQAVSDKIGGITPASKLADFIIFGLVTQLEGTFHFVCKGAVTRFDIAKHIVRVMKKDIKVNPVESSIFPLSAPRPISEYIECLEYAECLVGNELKNVPLLLSWDLELEAYIINDFKGIENDK